MAVIRWPLLAIMRVIAYNAEYVFRRGISRLLLPKRTSPRKRLTLTDSPPTPDANAKAVLDVMGTPSPEKGKRGSPVSKKVHVHLCSFTGNFF